MTSEDSTLGQEPTEIPPADLGSVFAPSISRAAGLGGLITRTSPVQVRQPEDTPAQQPQEAALEARLGEQTTPQPSASRPRRARVTRSTRQASGESPTEGAATDRLTQVVAYIPISLKARLQRAAAGGASYTTLTMAAVDAYREKLLGKWADARPSGSAFVGWQRGRRRNEEPMIPMTIRMVPADEATLDRLWTEAGAPNRSAYVEAALDLYLPRVEG